MALPTIEPPEHYSADVAYRLLRPIRPAVQAAQAELVTGINARRASLHFSNIGSLVMKVGEALQAGSINGSPTWAATAQAVVVELTPVLEAAAALEKVYAKRVGQKIADDADQGLVTGLEEAQNATLLDQADIDTMRGMLNAALDV